MKLIRISIITCILAVSAFADGKLVSTADTTKSLLERLNGQRVELRLKSGEKIAGKVEIVGDKLVHLSALAGMELFEAAVVLDDVSAVVVRAPVAAK